MRARKTLDPNRLSIATQRPGTDPRTWVTMGVVEELAYTASEGFVVVVRMVQGAHAGEEVVCELAHGLAAKAALVSMPFKIGDVAVCVVPEGDANTGPVVVGFLRASEAPGPSKVNGKPITLELLTSTYVVADAKHGAELELGPVRIVSPEIKLGPTPDPTQPFVRGQELADALGIFCAQVATVSRTTAQACVGPLTPLKLFFTLLATQLDTLKGKLIKGKILSLKITGE